MNKALRVVVADDEPELLDYYQAVLTSLGHDVIATASSGEELVRKCLELRPDLILSDIRMPGKDGVAAALEAFRAAPTRVVLATGYHAPDHIHDALDEMVLAYLAKPFEPKDLEQAIRRAEQRFDEFTVLLDCADDPQQAIRNRELLRVAKGLLMKRQSLGDRAAFERLRKMARDQNASLIEVAQAVVDAEQGPRSSSADLPRNVHLSNCG
jgi:response regulator NasT